MNASSGGGLLLLRSPATARALVLAALGLSVILPTADAGLLPAFEFRLYVRPIQLQAEGGEGNETNDVEFTLLTGRVATLGRETGLYAFVNTFSGGFADATRIEVINTQDQEGAVARAIRGECSGEQCAVERAFTNAGLQMGPNASLVLYSAEVAINHTEQSSFAIGTLIDPSAQFNESAGLDLEIGTSMLFVGQRVASIGEVVSPTNEVYAILPNENSTVTIQGLEGTNAYRGSQYVFRFYGQPRFDMRASGVLIPFQNETRAQFMAASGAELKSDFQPEALNAVLQSLGLGGELVPPDATDDLRSFAPILNGVFFGSADEPFVNDELAESVALAVVRFPLVEVTPREGGATVAGRAEFILLGEEGFYTTKTAAALGPVAVPSLAVILWVVGLGAIIAGFVLKPILAGPQLGGFGAIRLLGWVFHLVALVLAILLWDQEIKAFLGTSLITLFASGATGQGAVLAVTLFFEVVTFLVATALFGMPVRFLVNSGLKLGGLKKARGVGKGVGNLAVWAIGTPFIPLILNGFVAAVFEALRSALGAG